MEFVRPLRLHDEHWIAIEQHAARVANQLPGDFAGTIGACKDLVECVAKIVLAEAPAPEVSDFPKLVKKASMVVGGAAPRTDGDEQAATLGKGIALLTGALETAAQGLGEMRNSHGSGHGRPQMPDIAEEDVTLVRSYTQAWVTWVLARLARLLSNSVSALIEELTSNHFRRGLLRERMAEVGLEHLGDEEQERLGFVVAERGGRRGTFVVADDGLAPLVHDGAWPLPYQFGVAKGLLLTAEGTLRPIALEILGSVLPRLTLLLQERLLEEVEGVSISHALANDLEQRINIWSALRGMQGGIWEPLRGRWMAFAGQFFVAF